MDHEERLKAALADRYRIEREIGSGGMATVYLAQDLKHDRKVAVKVLNPELAATLGAGRFLREIKTAANLTHPHILPVHDSGEADGFLFYVMPYVEGESLRSRLTKEKQLPLEDAVQITREIADALAYAHEEGVIHQDVKPANIMLEAGHAVLADFGVAHAVAEAKDERITRTGTSLGTPAYMSPEQATGEQELEGRSDQYALGCVLYEMLAGHPPFTGAQVEAVIRQHITTEPPSVAQARPSVTDEVADVINRALAKSPADRFRTAGEMAATLALTTAPAEREARQAPNRVMLGLTIAALVVIVVAGVLVFGRPFGEASEPTHPPTAIAVLPFQNLSGEGPYAYFAPGLHDELLTQLARVEALTVMGRTSVMTYADGGTPLPQIADELGVGSIVEGSVQIAGDRLRVNIQLLDPETGGHLWADSYDRTLDDAFAVQSEIARQVVAALGAELREDEAGAIALEPTQDPEAYRLYLQGEEYRLRPGFQPQNLEIAQQFYERAIARDSTFALAYAWLSQVHGSIYWLGYDSHPVRRSRMREAAEEAVRLAPGLPHARFALGLAFYRERDFARALQELIAVAEELPGSAEVWEWVGYTHRRLGNWDEALAAYEATTAQDPRDADLFHTLGGDTFRFLHRYPEAVDAYNQALELAPDLWQARLKKAKVHFQWHGELDSLRNVL